MWRSVSNPISVDKGSCPWVFTVSHGLDMNDLGRLVRDVIINRLGRCW